MFLTILFLFAKRLARARPLPSDRVVHAVSRPGFWRGSSSHSA
jgi:hypothetical protein